MKFTFINPYGEEQLFHTIEAVNTILELDEKLWKQGSGDAAIIIKPEEQLILIKLKEGFFILYHPDYLSPEINSEVNETISHFIGGEEVQISKSLICNSKQAYAIISNYVIKQEIHNDYNWVDSFN